MPKNFFEKQRESLGLNRTEMAARLGTTAEAVRSWEVENYYPARLSIKKLAECYEASEAKVGDEVMALRRRIEDRNAKPVSSK